LFSGEKSPWSWKDKWFTFFINLSLKFNLH
jgi:hypothetical protein